MKPRSKKRKTQKAVAIKVQSIDFRKELLTCRAERKKKENPFTKRDFSVIRPNKCLAGTRPVAAKGIVKGCTGDKKKEK